jgi:hypothetical protein
VTPLPENLLEQVARFIERFVYFENRETYLLVAAWVIATYCYPSFACLGYLFFYSPEKQSGKTRALEVLDLLVSKSLGVLCSPTESTLFRTSGYVQLLDEGDGWRDRCGLSNVLNSGYSRSGFVMRSEPTANGGWQVNKFATYTPRALAGIGLNIISDTTRDRTFAIRMLRQPKDHRSEKLFIDDPDLKREVEQLKKTIGDTVKGLLPEIEAAYHGKFPMLDSLLDRTVDVSKPLFAICAQLCPRRLPDLLKAVELSRGTETEATDNLQVLAALYRLGDDPVIGMVSELTDRLCLEVEPDDITNALQTFGFTQVSKRINGDSPRRRYVIPRKQIVELLERYGVKDIVGLE